MSTVPSGSPSQQRDHAYALLYSAIARYVAPSVAPLLLALLGGLDPRFRPERFAFLSDAQVADVHAAEATRPRSSNAPPFIGAELEASDAAAAVLSEVLLTVARGGGDVGEVLARALVSTADALESVDELVAAAPDTAESHLVRALVSTHAAHSA